MKLKISTVAIILIAFLFGGLSANVTAEENNTKTQDVNVLKTKIGELEKTINTQAEQIQRTEKALDELRKQLDAQIEENNRLRELCKKAGIDTTKEAGSASKPIGRIIYRDKERDEEWFDRMYERFSDSIAYADSKFYNIKEGKLNQKTIGEGSFKIGTFVRTPDDCNVYKLLGEGEVLIVRPESQSTTTVYRTPDQREFGVKTTTYAQTKIYTTPELLFHVKGAADNAVEGEPFSSSKLIFIGSYNYQDRKIQSFIIYEPLTREQFAEALRGGFELVNYVERQGKTVKVPIR
jgi:regulator of replication initiation timing